MGARLKKEKAAEVTGVDMFPLPLGVVLDRFTQHDLNAGLPNVPVDEFEYILMRDVIEHPRSPKTSTIRLHDALSKQPDAKLILSTGNVGFFVTRLMLLLGQFNYGKRGILDMTHTRLFTFTSLRRLLEQSGFRIAEFRGVPGPFPLAMGGSPLSRLLVRVNKALIWVSRGMFSYQIFVSGQPVPSLDYPLKDAETQSSIRAQK